MNRLKLIDDLNKVLPGIASGNVVLEGADTVVFKNGHLYSYNSTVSVDVTESQETGLNGVVKAEDFYKALTKLPEDEITIETTNDSWKIQNGKIKVKMNLLPFGKIHERFDSLNPFDDKWIEIDGEDFNNALTVCDMPKNTSNLSGIFCNGKKFISTDSYTINSYDTKEEYPVFWISNNAVNELKKWKNFKAVQLNKMWLQFKSEDGTVFSVRSMDTANYPFDKINSVIENTVSIEPSLSSKFTEAFYKAVERASIFSEENNGHATILVSIDKDKTTVSSKRLSGEYNEDVEDVVSEKPFNLILDIAMIQDSAKFFTDFSLIERGETVMIVFREQSAFKMFSNIV